MWAAFHYPELLNTLYNRYRSYNRTLELLEKWEREGHIFVIRPEIHCPELQREADGQHGYDVMKDHYEELQAYLRWIFISLENRREGNEVIAR